MQNYLLTTQQLLELSKAHRQSKSKRDADRIKAVYLLGKGWQVMMVCEALLIDDDTARNYFRRYQENGLVGLLQDNYRGNEGRLTLEEEQLLEQHLEEYTYRTVKEVIAYVEQEFDERYSESGMTALLHRLDFVYKKPKRLPARANEEAQQQFIAFYKRLRRTMKATDQLYFMDGVHPQYTPVVSYGWIKKGEDKALKTTAWQPRLNINGVINIDTLEMVVTYEKIIDRESTKRLLSKMREEQPRGQIIIICDKARYYDHEEVRKHAKQLNIRIIYLPPYSPNLNLIERVWLYFKKMTVYNRFYPTFEEFKHACQHFFDHVDYHYDNLRSLLTEKFQKLCYQ